MRISKKIRRRINKQNRLNNLEWADCLIKKYGELPYWAAKYLLEKSGHKTLKKAYSIIYSKG